MWSEAEYKQRTEAQKTEQAKLTKWIFGWLYAAMTILGTGIGCCLLLALAFISLKTFVLLVSMHIGAWFYCILKSDLAHAKWDTAHWRFMYALNLDNFAIQTSTFGIMLHNYEELSSEYTGLKNYCTALKAWAEKSGMPPPSA